MPSLLTSVCVASLALSTITLSKMLYLVKQNEHDRSILTLETFFKEFHEMGYEMGVASFWIGVFLSSLVILRIQYNGATITYKEVVQMGDILQYDILKNKKYLMEDVTEKVVPSIQQDPVVILQKVSEPTRPATPPAFYSRRAHRQRSQTRSSF